MLTMEESQIATIGMFCLNEACEDYNKINQGNVIKSGKTDKGGPALYLQNVQKELYRDQGNDILPQPPYRRRNNRMYVHVRRS